MSQSQQSQSQSQPSAPDLTLADLEASEQMLQASLQQFFPNTAPIEWARILLECQFSDIHIEEL